MTSKKSVLRPPGRKRTGPETSGGISPRQSATGSVIQVRTEKPPRRHSAKAAKAGDAKSALNNRPARQGDQPAVIGVKLHGMQPLPHSSQRQRRCTGRQAQALFQALLDAAAASLAHRAGTAAPAPARLLSVCMDGAGQRRSARCLLLRHQRFNNRSVPMAPGAGSGAGSGNQAAIPSSAKAGASGRSRHGRSRMAWPRKPAGALAGSMDRVRGKGRHAPGNRFRDFPPPGRRRQRSAGS